jgi:YHS domain-containing protein
VARFILLLLLFVTIARTFWRFVDAVVRGVAGPASQPGRRSNAPAAVRMQQCPVCGTYVVPGKAISIVSSGSPVYFDSEKCRAEFQSR